MKVNICGMPHEVIECEDKFDVDLHFGQIDYKTCEIRVNKDISDENKKETIIHEMIHGILVHLGYSEEAQNEQFVQALANAIYQGFSIKEEERIKFLEEESMLNKIRAEMLKEAASHSGTGEEVIEAYADGLRKGLCILDKHKEERED